MGSQSDSEGKMKAGTTTAQNMMISEGTDEKS